MKILILMHLWCNKYPTPVSDIIKLQLLVDWLRFHGDLCCKYRQTQNRELLATA